MSRPKQQGRKGPRRSGPQRGGNRNLGRQSAAVATSRRMQTNKPRMTAGFDGATISHREFIADVSGSELFGLTAFAINPGLSTLFPWLSNIAVNYETYKFTKLQFHYETAVSTTTGGSILLAVDYDAADVPPANKREMMSYASATRSAAWQESTFNCRPSDLCKFVKERYVRSKVEGGDIKTYDVGNFFIATQGTPAAEMGELYVSYTIQLHTPQYNSLVANEESKVAEVVQQYAHLSISAPQAFAVGATATVLYDVIYANTIGCTVVGGFIQLPAGTYSFNFQFRQAGIFNYNVLVDSLPMNPARVTPNLSAGAGGELSGFITVDGTNLLSVVAQAPSPGSIAVESEVMFTRL